MRSKIVLGVSILGFSCGAFAVVACSSSSDDGSASNQPDSSTSANDGAASGDGSIVVSPDGGSIFDAGVDPYKKLPCNVTVGTGSGTFDTSSVASNPGDVICIKSGSYSGGTIQHLNDRTIQNDGGQVVITGIVSVGNLVDVTFSGSGDDATSYGFQRFRKLERGNFSRRRTHRFDLERRRRRLGNRRRRKCRFRFVQEPSRPHPPQTIR